jgi:hypothetical protein
MKTQTHKSIGKMIKLKELIECACKNAIREKLVEINIISTFENTHWRRMSITERTDK